MKSLFAIVTKTYYGWYWEVIIDDKPHIGPFYDKRRDALCGLSHYLKRLAIDEDIKTKKKRKESM